MDGGFLRKLGIVDGLISLVVIGVFGWFVLMSLAEKNPKIDEWIKSIKPLYEKIDPIPESESTQQTWQEKRSMI